MNIIEFYNKVGGNYDEVKSRLMTDERIIKFVRKFPDSGDYEALRSALNEKNWNDAFRYSHNLKGMCLNLSLTALFEVSSALCENLRDGSPKQDCEPMMAAVDVKYAELMSAIAGLSAE